MTPPVISLDTQGLTDPNYVKDALMQATQLLTGDVYLKHFNVLSRAVEFR